MKSLTPVLTGITVISAIAAAVMWRELHLERALTAGLQAQLAEARSLPRPGATAAQRNPADAPTAVAAPAATTLAKPDAPAAKPAPAPNASLQDFRAREKEMMQDPEYRKARLAQQRLNVERNYPGLVEELGLSQKDADKLFDLIAESQFNMNNMMNDVLGGGQQVDQAARAELSRKQQAMAREQQESIAELLGPGMNARYQEYQQSQGARQQVNQWGQQLAQAGAPLSPVQQKSLTTAMVAEQKRMQQEVQPLVRNINQADPQARMQLQEDLMKREDEFNRRVLDAASQSLTAQQLASLKQQFEVQAAMNKAQQRMERRRMEVQGPQTNASGIF